MAPRESEMPATAGGDATPRNVGVASAQYEPTYSLPSAPYNTMMAGFPPGAFSQPMPSPGAQTPLSGAGSCCFVPQQQQFMAQQLQSGGMDAPAHGLWRWSADGKLRLTCEQPIVAVPVVQEVHRRDKIIEVPQVDVVDAVKPRVYTQGVEHEVPKMEIAAETIDLEVPTFKYVEREVVVPIVTGYTHKFVPKWEVREVPRPIVKYVGEQECIEVDVPQVKFVDRIVEREVVVDTIEKKVPKIIEVPKYVDTVKYVWKPVEKIIHVERFVPKFDVSLECPAPLIVPYPVQTVKELPAVMLRKQPQELGEVDVEVVSPEGTVRVLDDYIRQYKKSEHEQQALFCTPGECCGVDREEEVVFEAVEVPGAHQPQVESDSPTQQPEGDDNAGQKEESQQEAAGDSAAESSSSAVAVASADAQLEGVALPSHSQDP